ncbi:MAG: acetyl-CoA carboxylase biotin carboxylase subunit [Deltaproteobacteria bacterium]|nr:acetyl-CoA carboxylase biotin carboxylase subunit [Deltaproteobacteria bacterium]
MFRKVLIANRGEIALRVQQACRELGIRTVAVYSEADAGAPHARAADEAVLIGPPPARQSYLDADRILEAARATGAEAIHPGYGFLSENAGFARRCREAGIVFIGPQAEAIESMGSKAAARDLMRKAGVPVVPGSPGPTGSLDEAKKIAADVGYPVFVKASGGGGGIGMQLVRDDAGLDKVFEGARSRAESLFGDASVYIEKCLPGPRHVEFQVFGDARGNIVHLFERECSIQRRHQKVIEETPSTALTPELRKQMGEAAVRAAAAVDYVNAGTIEFLVDADRNFYFIEMNTRLQVEHPVTEVTCGVDLVHLQLRVAAGELLPFSQDAIKPSGHAIEFRIYAENPAKNFMPSPGTISKWKTPEGEGVRVDSGVGEGSVVSVHYDPLLAKLIVSGASREEAVLRALVALEGYVVEGIHTNIDLHKEVLRHPEFRAGEFDTGFLYNRLKPQGS